MRAALGAWDWATVLTLIADECGVSQLQLAELTGFSQPHVSRLMKGQAQCYDIRAINRMIDGLGAPRALAGLASSNGDRGDTVQARPTNEVSPTRRRSILASSIAIPLAAVLGDGPHAVVSHARAVEIRALLPNLYTLDDQAGSATIGDIAESCMHTVDALLNHADYGEAAGRELQLAYGELAEMTGWLDVDAGRLTIAGYHLSEALRTAQIAESLELEVLVLASMTMLSRQRRRPRDAIQLARLAQRRAGGWGTPRLLSLLALREAVGWAQAGDATAANNAMARAQHLFDPVPRDDDPAWISYFTESELSSMRAAMHMYLGGTQRAIVDLRAGLERLPKQYARNRALYSTRLALAHLADGDEKEACETVKSTLPLFADVNSGRATAHLTECLSALGRSRTSCAREVVAQARSLGLSGAIT